MKNQIKIIKAIFTLLLLLAPVCLSAEIYELVSEWGGRGGGNGLFNGIGGVAVDKNGYIYVVDILNNRVQKFSSSGNFITKWGSEGYTDGYFSSPLGIAVDNECNVYVAGGNSPYIQKFDSYGNFIRKWGDFSGIGIAVDKDGNVIVADHSNNKIKKYNANGELIIAWGEKGSGNGQFNTPSGIASDSFGNVYVVENERDGNRRVQKFAPDGQYLRQWPLPDICCSWWPQISGCAVDGEGNIYVSNPYRSEIMKFSGDGALLFTYKNQGSGDGQIGGTEGIAIDANGYIYVADSGNFRIQKFNPDFSFRMKFGSFGGDGPGYFNLPLGAAIYENGAEKFIYVTEMWNCRVQKFTLNGDFVSILGTRGYNPGQLYYPHGIAADKNGNIFVGDQICRVQKFDSSGNFSVQWGRQGSENGEFGRINGIALDRDAQYVYVASDERVQKFTPTGGYLTQWGSRGTGDGQFNQIGGITVDTSGNVFVADFGPYQKPSRIQKFTPDGAFIKSWNLGITEWTGTPALFGLATDSEGNIYVNDSGTGQFLKFSSEGLLITRIAGLSPNGIAVDNNGSLYIVNRKTNSVRKYRKNSSVNNSITIKSPNGGENWIRGSSHNITWDSAGTFGNVKIEYSANGGDSWTLITGGTVDDGSHPWKVPSTLSSNCLVRVSEAIYGDPGDVSDAEFSIVDTPMFSISGTITTGGAPMANVILSGLPGDPQTDETGFYLASVPSGWRGTVIPTGGDGKFVPASRTYTSITANKTNQDYVVGGACLRADFSEAIAIFLDGSKKLRKIDSKGVVTPVLNFDCIVNRIQQHGQGNVIIVFNERQLVDCTEPYLMVRANIQTNAIKGIDHGLNAMVWTSTEINPSVQVDGNGNLYYLMLAEGGKTILRKYIDETNIVNLTSENIAIRSWQVDGDGTVVFTGKDLSAQTYFLRKISPEGAIADIAAGAKGNWVARFPDNRVYAGIWGNAPYYGTYRLSSDLAYLDGIAALAPYLGYPEYEGQAYQPDYNVFDLAVGHDPEYRTGFTTHAGTDLYSYVRTPNGTIAGLAGEGGIRTLVRYYPTPEIISLKLIDRPAILKNSLNQLIVAGTNRGINELVLYDLPSRHETSLLNENIEIYHVHVVSNGSILIEGLDLEENKYIIGVIDITGAQTNQVDALDSRTWKKIANLTSKPADLVVTDPGALSALLTVTSPNGGEYATAGFDRDITWTSTGDVASVNIDYSTDGGSNWSIVAAATPNDGRHAWSVPDSPATACLIRISDAADGMPSDQSDAVFTILSPGVEMVSPPSMPAGPPIGGIGAVYEFTVGGAASSMGDAVQYRIDWGDGSDSGWLVAGVTQASHSWPGNGTYAVRAMARCAIHNTIESAWSPSWTINVSDKSQIFVTSPVSGIAWEKFRMYPISWLKQGSQNAYVKILLFKGTSTLVMTLALKTPNDGLFEWLVPSALAAGTYFIRVQTIDNLIKDDSDKFTVFVPSITITAPTIGTAWVKSAVKTISWSKQGIQDANVKIQLFMGTTKKLDIALSTPNSGSFEWLVPSTLANGNYTIKVITLDGKVTGVSKAFAIAAGMIKLTAPVTGNKWYRGMPYDITWTSEGLVNPNVKIQLYQGTTKKLDISLSTPTSAGVFNWAIPATLAPATNYFIQITAIDNLVKGKSGLFTVTPGLINVTAPTAGANWQRGVPHIITWTKQGDQINANVKIQLYKGTTLLSTIVSITPNDGSYEWTIPTGQALASNYKIRITTVDNLVKADSASFTISATAGLTLTAPNGKERFVPTDMRVVRWTRDPNVLEVKLEFSRDNGGTFTTIADHVENSGSFEWQVPVNFTQNGIVRISDASGKPWLHEGLLEFKVKFNRISESNTPETSIWFGGAAATEPGYGFARIGIGSGRVEFGGLSREIDMAEGNWHELRVRFDFRRDTAEIRLDDQVVFENAPLGTGQEYHFLPSLVIQSGGETPLDLFLDDLAINVIGSDPDIDGEKAFTVLKEDFDRYDGKANVLQNCWRQAEMPERVGKLGLKGDGAENQMLRVRTEAGRKTTISLPFSLPETVPFDISDKCFVIDN